MFDEFDTIDGLIRWRDFLVEHQRLLGFIGGCPIGSIGSELAELDERARRRVAASFDRWESGLRRGLTAMEQRGDLHGDPEDLALAVLAALQGGLLLTQVQRSTRPLEKVLDTMIEHIGLLRNNG
jgi:TetR/AcrR family transcriptional repressor of nem operon